MRTALLLATILLCSCGRTTSYGRPPGCIRNPEQTPALTVQQTNGAPRVWNRELCIPVTYAPALEKLKPTLQAALDAWDQVDCTGLCFEPLISNKELPLEDRDRRLHIADNGGGLGSAWEVLSDGRTSQTLHATIFISASATMGDVMKQLGFVLGFEARQAAFRDTVLEEFQVPNPRTGLGALDRQSVCAVYPACR